MSVHFLVSGFPDPLTPCVAWKDHFAVASTDAGHNGTVGDGSFAINGPETQIDFGHRSVHLTAEYSKIIVEVRRASFGGVEAELRRMES